MEAVQTYASSATRERDQAALGLKRGTNSEMMVISSPKIPYDLSYCAANLVSALAKAKNNHIQ